MNKRKNIFIILGIILLIVILAISSYFFFKQVFDDNKLMNKIYDSLSDLAGIQKFDEVVPFIKIWVNNEKFSQEIIKRIRKIII